jgi:hypothetical protein
MPEHLVAPPQRFPVQLSAVGCRPVNKLAPKQVNPFHDPVEDHRPLMFEIPRPGLVLWLLRFRRPDLGRLLPKEPTDVLVVQQRHHQFPLLGEHGPNDAVLIDGKHLREEPAKTFCIRQRLPQFRIPAVVEGIQGDPLADEDKVSIAAFELFGSLEPTEGPVEADGDGRIGVRIQQCRFDGFPAAAKGMDREECGWHGVVSLGVRNGNPADSHSKA